MNEILISKEQAKQFAYDCFDVIIRDIKVMWDKKEASVENKLGIEEQKHTELNLRGFSLEESEVKNNDYLERNSKSA